MTRELGSIFAELGLSQYLNAFIDQGFDSWDTILDIQESDLDALGVKLGHRRKLQRRIANSRGIAPSVSLACTAKPTSDDPKQDGLRRDHVRGEGGHEVNGVAKRKYRRHPKPDENAPERPPSAYVLFSNKKREDLKSHNLTFTEIAKLVGENWQILPPAERELYEGQANAAKEKYHCSLAEYKKTPEYRKYLQYLHDFKEKQARQSRGHDGLKRPKLEPQRPHPSCGATPGGATPSGSRSGSSSERLQGSEPPPSRQERMDASASLAGSQHSPAAPTSKSQQANAGDGPRVARLDGGSPGDPHPQFSWTRRSRAASTHQHLPSLSDMLDDGTKGKDAAIADSRARTAGRAASGQPKLIPEAPPVLSLSRVPRLYHEPSSTSSAASRSSTASFGRTPGDGSLPIYALLADRTIPTAPEMEPMSAPGIKSAAGLSGGPDPMPDSMSGPRGYGFQSESSAFQKMTARQSSDGDVLMTPMEAAPVAPGGNGKHGLDGMSALLHAGEIVGRRDHN